MSHGTLTRTVPACSPENQPWPPIGLGLSLSMTACAAGPFTGGAAPLSHCSPLSQLLIDPSWIPMVIELAACAGGAAASGEPTAKDAVHTTADAAKTMVARRIPGAYPFP